MTTIRLSAIVGKDRKLIVDLPEDAPTGVVELTIQQAETTSSATTNPARDAARAKLLAAGLLSTAHHLPPATRIPTDLEVLMAGQLPPNARPSEQLIDEDRDE